MRNDPSLALVRADHSVGDAGEVPLLCESWLKSEYWQIDTGRFDSRLREAAIGNTMVVEETQNRTVLKRGAIPDDRCNFCFARNFGGTGRCHDQPLTSTSFSFVPSGEFDIMIPPSSIVVISVKREEFMTAAELERHWIEGNERRPLTWEMPMNHPLAMVVDTLLAQDAAPPHGQAALDAGYLNAVLFDSILTTLDDPMRKEVRVAAGRTNAFRIVRAACEFVDSVRNDPLTVLDLCRALNVSRRTLQYCFAEIYGIAPLAYLRRVRLNRARRDLSTAPNDRVSVTGVATHWGFWHLGRFSVDYRQLFGESPSDTLRRALA